MFRYRVQGRYGFPLDMLRYDRCWPVDGIGAMHDSIAQDSLPYTSGPFEVILMGEFPPTVDRWASFQWSVDRDSIEEFK